MRKLKNKAIKIDIILVISTIIFPLLLLRLNIKVDIFTVPLFIILYIFFVFLNNQTHKVYLNMKQTESKENINMKSQSNKKTIKYTSILIVTGVLLFLVGEFLGDTLENLCNIFNISEMIIGTLLGFITSIPELITFFESQKYHKESTDEMFGVVEATNNLLTSNILNLFVIQTIGILCSFGTGYF